jgi:hypothetical protein
MFPSVGSIPFCSFHLLISIGCAGICRRQQILRSKTACTEEPIYGYHEWAISNDRKIIDDIESGADKDGSEDKRKPV